MTTQLSSWQLAYFLFQNKTKNKNHMHTLCDVLHESYLKVCSRIHSRNHRGIRFRIFAIKDWQFVAPYDYHLIYINMIVAVIVIIVIIIIVITTIAIIIMVLLIITICMLSERHVRYQHTHVSTERQQLTKTRASGPPVPWWLHPMEKFSALLAFYAGNSPVTGEFPAQRPVTRSFDVFFDQRLNRQFSKQWRPWWFETLIMTSL